MNEGMPRHRDRTEKGHLFIDFNVVFPDNNFLEIKKLPVSDIFRFKTSTLDFTHHPLKRSYIEQVFV